MEARLGCDFGHVRIHAERSAEMAARAVGARAYTAGSSIVFGRGAWDPATQSGQRLLVHELVHVRDHVGSGTPRLFLSPAEGPVASEQDLPTGLVSLVNNRDARLRDPANGFAPIEVTRVGPDSRIRNPDRLGDTLKDEAGHHRVIPEGTEVTVDGNRTEAGFNYVHVRWGDQEAWTSSSNLRRPSPRTVPMNTRVDELASTEHGGEEMVHVRWSGGEGWTSSSNLTRLDASVATPLVDGDPQLQADKEKVRPSEYAEKAGEHGVSAEEVKTLRSVLRRVPRTKAYLRDPATGASLKPQQLDPGTHLVLLDERELVVDGAPLLLAHVLTLDGVERWTAAGNLAAADPRLFDETGLIVGSRLDQLQHPAVAAAMERYWGLQVERLLSSKGFTPNQAALIESARAFVADPVLQAAQPALQVPAYALREDDMTLSADLVKRLDVFYRFLLHARLIDGFYKPGMSGVRSFATAHWLSTLYALNPASGVLAAPEAQRTTARQLVEIGGWDPNTPTGTRWATVVQVQRLAYLLGVVDAETRPVIDTLLDPIEFGAGLFQLPVRDAAEAQAEIGEIVNALHRAQRDKQADKAAEGYPKGDPRRRPNVRKTDISLHCGGEAIDIFFNYRFNFFDPIIDAIALVFGLYRAARGGGSPEYWHYERIGVPLAGRVIGEDGRDTANGLEPEALKVNP